MFSTIRKRITFANVAMTLALVFAMTGGAYAAKKYLITTTKQISPKVLKQLKGNRGPAGPAGEKGAPERRAQGPKGETGAQGVKGDTGGKGEQGAAGPTGATGATGTFGGQNLGLNVTETGAWSASTATAFTGFTETISFPAPLNAALGSGNVFFIDTSSNDVNTGLPAAQCTGL